jgi:hypothetical protein
MSTPSLQEQFDDLLFGIRRSVRYHNRRRSFYDRLHKFNTIIAVVGGSAVIATILGEFGTPWPLAFSVLVTISAAIDLALSSPQAARSHHDLSRKYFDIEKEMIACQSPSDQDLVGWTERRLTIEADEPPVLHVLNTICHNELCRALGYGDSVNLTYLQRLFSNFFDLSEHKIKANIACQK